MTQELTPELFSMFLFGFFAGGVVTYIFRSIFESLKEDQWNQRWDELKNKYDVCVMAVEHRDRKLDQIKDIAGK